MGFWAPIDTTGGRATSDTDLQIALRLVRRSGVLGTLSPPLEVEVGRPRTISLVGFFVGAQLNALARHHRGHLVEIARVLNALTPAQRERLGLRNWDPAQTYDRIDRLFVRLCDVLEAGNNGVDAQWFANRFAAAG
jgi:hypothetical protein